MKKILISIFAIIFTAYIAFASNTDFSTALKNCSNYEENGSVKTEGVVVKSSKQIIGWERDRCVYKETVNFADINTTITCKLNRSQIDELTAVMSAYELLHNYSNESVDTSSLENVQNNPVVKVWNRYLNDKATCSIGFNQ